MPFVPIPAPHILKECIASLMNRLHSLYLEKGAETNLPIALKSHVMWYMSQGKNVVYAGDIYAGDIYYDSRMCIVFQQEDGSYDMTIDHFRWKPDYYGFGEPIHVVSDDSHTYTYYYRMYEYHDITTLIENLREFTLQTYGIGVWLLFDVEIDEMMDNPSGHSIKCTDILDIIVYKKLNIKLRKVLTNAYIKHQSRQYMEEIWQKACHPKVVEKVIASYPSLEAFVDSPDAITPICMLKSILA